MTKRIIKPTTKYGGYGYRMITGLFRNEGWKVNRKRVERIWRKDGLKIPAIAGIFHFFSPVAVDLTLIIKTSFAEPADSI